MKPDLRVCRVHVEKLLVKEALKTVSYVKHFWFPHFLSVVDFFYCFNDLIKLRVEPLLVGSPP